MAAKIPAQRAGLGAGRRAGAGRALAWWLEQLTAHTAVRAACARPGPLRLIKPRQAGSALRKPMAKRFHALIVVIASVRFTSSASLNSAAAAA